MVIGAIVVGIVAMLLGIYAAKAFLSVPQCPKCHIPMQTVEETIRELGHYGVETVTYYECNDCYRKLQRAVIFSYIG